jgi:dipeptidyl-peptidase 4
MIFVTTKFVLLLAILFNSPGEALSSPQQPGGNRLGGHVYKSRIIPHWYAENTHFWYRNDLHHGMREFIVVDAVQGIRRPAFDHDLLAKAMRESGIGQIRSDRLPIEQLRFELNEKKLIFHANKRHWECDLEKYTIRPFDGERTITNDHQSALAPENVPRASIRTGPETALTFVNRTEGAIRLFWLDTNGRRKSYGTLAAGVEREQHTYAGHVWEVVDRHDVLLAVYQAPETPLQIEITGKVADYRQRRSRSAQNPGPRKNSPDGKWSAVLKEENIFLRSTDAGQEFQLSDDGHPGNGYGMLEWAPDGKTLVAFRIEPGDRKEVHLIESSPPTGGRAKLHSRPYPLPGDKMTSYELNLFDITDKKCRKTEADRIDLGRPRLRWNADGRRFTYAQVDRGHQRFRLVEVDSHTGVVRNIIDERTDTFIWTAHTENSQLRRVNWLSNQSQIVYVSECDGWRHLYMIDVDTGAKKPITHGSYVVRAIEQIDEENQQITFRASGKNRGQDPYFNQYYRIRFDGTGLVALTEGNGSHAIEYSPDKKFLIDTYSRVDMAPVHELRRTSDGKLICELERADISELERNGWNPPEVFVAKGRDGITDIWGIICRPRNFDAKGKYPIIEDIYAGPQSAYVPKTFSRSSRYADLTDLGFIVVKIDGMGTAHRSKAFHDVCWKNLRDAGFPDRIGWIKAAAAQYPAMDVSRVGIFGNSAGGQNAAGAVLFHPTFYTAAVASCGCHDNRMDKASWNEQWMGYPVGPQYAECSNIDNAQRLRGHLMLIVGEMDSNVPPESTMRFADALIKADKDFDLVVIPGGGHGMGGSYGRRRMHDFFLRHLLGKEPPNRNAPVH